MSRRESSRDEETATTVMIKRNQPTIRTRACENASEIPSRDRGRRILAADARTTSGLAWAVRPVTGLRSPWFLLLRALALFLISVAAHGLKAQEKEQQDSAERPRADQTAEDVLRALQENRPPNEVLQPSDQAQSSKARHAVLLPEGASIVDRLGYVVRDADGWAFVSHKNNDQASMPLLPNSTAELMIRTAAGAPGKVTFLISGEVTVFQGANFLLLRSAQRAAPVDEAPPANREPAPQSSDAEAEPVKPPSAEEVLKALRAEHPNARTIDDQMSAEASGETRSDLLKGLGGVDRSGGDPSEMRRTLRPDGTILDRRTGHFIEQGGRRLFVADSDRPEEAEPPWDLLPCQATEFMLNMWSQNPHGLVFVVSGELTLFDGRNYLLPRLAMRQVASDNLRK